MGRSRQKEDRRIVTREMQDDGWERVICKLPAFDCLTEGCTIHEPPCSGDYGRGCEMWNYALVHPDKDAAFSIEVFSGFDVNGQQRSGPNLQYPYGSLMALCTTWRSSRDLMKKSRSAYEESFIDCLYLGKCGPEDHSWGLLADEFYKEWGGQDFEQSDEFWKALQAKATEFIGNERAQSVEDKYVVCRECGGKGTLALSDGMDH